MVKGPKDQAVSERLPVARGAVDISLAHLDRPFDYLVPASMDRTAVPGCRVRVRFAGQLVDGYLLDRVQTSEHQGRLARLERVISPEPVLTPEIFDMLDHIEPGRGGELQLTDAIALLLEHQSVFGYVCREGRYDVGQKLDFLRANIELALARPDLGPELEAWLRALLEQRRPA